MRRNVLVLLLACVTLAACQTTGDISYTPTVPLIPGLSASIAAVTVQDVRDEKPNRLATLRGLYGNPAKVFDTTKPVSDEVAAIVIAALRARGMFALAAPYRIQINLRTLYGDTYFARRTFIDMDLNVVDPAGRVVYKDTVKQDKVGFDVFSDIEDVVAFTQLFLNTTIDGMLDKAAFRAALSPPGKPFPSS